MGKAFGGSRDSQQGKGGIHLYGKKLPGAVAGLGSATHAIISGPVLISVFLKTASSVVYVSLILRKNSPEYNQEGSYENKIQTAEI